MKKLFLFLGLMLPLGAMAAPKFAPRVMEAELSQFGTPATVSVSTSAWTKVNPSSSLTSRSGIIVSVPSTNNANVVGILGNCTSTAIATTVRPIEIAKGNGFTLFPLADDVCLWLLSLHTAAESVHYQEITQ
jgi:hypothetical protein